MLRRSTFATHGRKTRNQRQSSPRRNSPLYDGGTFAGLASRVCPKHIRVAPEQARPDGAQPDKSDPSHFISTRTSDAGSVSRPALPKPLLTLPRVTRRLPPPPPPSGFRRVLNFLTTFRCLQVHAVDVLVSLHSCRKARNTTELSRYSDTWLCAIVQNAPGVKSIKRGSWFNPETLINEKVLCHSGTHAL